MKKFLMGAAAAALLAGPANAAFFDVTVGSVVNDIPSNNDFQTELFGVPLNYYTTTGASVSLSGKVKLTFEYLGSESGFTDVFKAEGLDGTIMATESNADIFFTPQLLGSATFDAGVLDSLLTFFANGVMTPTFTFNVGEAEFGIFLPTKLAEGASYKTNTLYIGLDDQIRGDDDNHDDFLIRVTAVPEPATWAMMIAGFGLVGGAMRRRAKTSPSIRAVYS